MGFWSINPYVGCAFGCAYCYARYAHRYVAERTVAATPDATELVELPPWLAFERRIFVKRNAPEVLRATLRSQQARGQRTRTRGQRSEARAIAPASDSRFPASRFPFPDSRFSRLWEGETIVIGTATDPYQPAERTYRVTRGILEVLAEERGLSVVIITKSALVTRDLDVLRTLANRSSLTIHLSLITLDRELARRIEPRAPTPEARVRALERLAAAGIDVGINIMPVLPGITDRPAMLDAVVRRVTAAGASHINACALRLRVTARRRYLPFIESEFPALAGAYRSAYTAGSQMNDTYREGLRRFLRARCRKHGITYGTPERRGTASDGTARVGQAWTTDEGGAERDAVRSMPAPPVTDQLALFPIGTVTPPAT
jgi:DNA repair photolyase